MSDETESEGTLLNLYFSQFSLLGTLFCFVFLPLHLVERKQPHGASLFMQFLELPSKFHFRTHMTTHTARGGQVLTSILATNSVSMPLSFDGDSFDFG